jgi:hypothetical protein
MSYDFNLVTSEFGYLRQLQLVGNYIYGSNYFYGNDSLPA